jgi:hypothetical protein
MVRQYRKWTRRKLCPCGRPGVGLYRCRNKAAGKVVDLYACEECLELEAVHWEHHLITERAGEDEPQLMLNFQPPQGVV